MTLRSSGTRSPDLFFLRQYRTSRRIDSGDELLPILVGYRVPPTLQPLLAATRQSHHALEPLSGSGLLPPPQVDEVRIVVMILLVENLNRDDRIVQQSDPISENDRGNEPLGGAILRADLGA